MKLIIGARSCGRMTSSVLDLFPCVEHRCKIRDVGVV